MASKGEKVITASDFETRLRSIQKSLDSILAGVAVDIVNGAMGNFIIQSGVVSVPAAASVSITFPVAYSVAPRITTGVSSTNQDFSVTFHSLTTASFSLRGNNRTSGSACLVHWVAFGKRG